MMLPMRVRTSDYMRSTLCDAAIGHLPMSVVGFKNQARASMVESIAYSELTRL